MKLRAKNIDEYGLIGDLQSAALVGIDGSIDWCCLPRFDSASVFAAILDLEKGGYFRVTPTIADCKTKQMYLPDTNILLTRFLSADGVGEVVDFMPWRGGETGMRAIVRIVRCVRGTIDFEMECLPAFDYARASHQCQINQQSATFEHGDLRLRLNSTTELKPAGTGVTATFTLPEDCSHSFVLELDAQAQGQPDPSQLERFAAELLMQTKTSWQKWAGRCTYKGRWREMVMRSALALKLLIYEPTGAIIAAPTCSLPEEIGGVRNWDYRYTWIRDAAFTVYAFLRLGYDHEAAQFMEWLQGRACEDQEVGPLQVMYRVDGSSDLNEATLDHLSGYMNSAPVRVGNSAKHQLQLDIYGELMDSIYLYNKYAEPISYDFWKYVVRLAEWVCDNWNRPDRSIWEVRRESQHYTYSKMQCWVALDRCMRVATKRNLPLDLDRIRSESQKIYEAIMTEGWHNGCFVQVFGGDTVDANALLFPLMMFVSPKDSRMQSTLKRIRKDLVSDTLVYRYKQEADVDGLTGGEGTFSVCSFWLVEVMSRSGELQEARFAFEKMLTYANHLGLYAEEIGASGEALGNFPQAFTHLGLISAALSLDTQLSKGGH